MIQPAYHSKRPLEITDGRDISADEAIAKALYILSNGEQAIDGIDVELKDLKERLVKHIRTTEQLKAEHSASPAGPMAQLLQQLADPQNLNFQEDPQFHGLFTLALLDKEFKFYDNLAAHCAKRTLTSDLSSRLLKHLETCMHPWGKILIPTSSLIASFDTDWKLGARSVISLDLSLPYRIEELPAYMEVQAFRTTKSFNGHLYSVPDILLTALAAMLLEEASSLEFYKNYKLLFKAYEEFTDLSIRLTFGEHAITYRSLNIHTFTMMLAQGEPEMCYLESDIGKILQPCVREEKTKNVLIPFSKFLFRSGVKFFKNPSFLERFHTFIVSGVTREFIDLTRRKNGKSAFLINQFSCMLFLRNSKERPSHLRLSGTLFQREFNCVNELTKGRGRGLKAISDLNYIFFTKEEPTDLLYTTTLKMCEELEKTSAPLLGSFIIKQGWLDPAHPFEMSSAELQSIASLMQSFYSFAKNPLPSLFEDITKRLLSLENSCPAFLRTERFNEFILLIRATVLPTAIAEEAPKDGKIVQLLPIFHQHPYMQIFFNCALKLDTKELYDKFYPLFVRLLPITTKQIDTLKIDLATLENHPFPWIGYLDNGTCMHGTLTLSDAIKRQPVSFNDDYAYREESRSEGREASLEGLLMEELPLNLPNDDSRACRASSVQSQDELPNIEDFINEL